MNMPQPSIGRIVHYVLPASGKHRPAIITEVYGDSKNGQVNLLVFKDGGNDGNIHQPFEWATAINQGQEYKSIGTWHWPEGNEAQSVAMASHEQRIRELEEAVKIVATMIQQRAAIKYEPVEELKQPGEITIAVPAITTATAAPAIMQSPTTEHRPVRKR